MAGTDGMHARTDDVHAWYGTHQWRGSGTHLHVRCDRDVELDAIVVEVTVHEQLAELSVERPEVGHKR
eukprot:54229-Chlamydomonas_euryale.AAC.8